MRKLIMSGAFAALTLSVCTASAQNVNSDPNFRSVTLSGGFTPDPYKVQVRSGGSVNAENIDSACRGYISDAPDVRLNYTKGSLPLIISVNSSADTTLVINAPDGRWYCDDDGGENGLNPSIRFSPAQSGRYEIWIGTYGNSNLESAELSISELESQ